MKLNKLSFFVTLILLFGSCTPKLTQEITIEILPKRNLGNNYSQIDFDKDINKTLNTITARLDNIGAYYGTKQMSKFVTAKLKCYTFQKRQMLITALF